MISTQQLQELGQCLATKFGANRVVFVVNSIAYFAEKTEKVLYAG